MGLGNTKTANHSRVHLGCMVLATLLLTSGCAGSNFPQFGKFGKSANDQTRWEKTTAEAQSSGSHLNWSTSYAQATQTAAQQGKLVMAHFTQSDACVWCVKLEEEVFDTPEFMEWADANVVPLKVDLPVSTRLPRELEMQNKQLKSKYSSEIKGYPTILFLNTQGQVVAKMGYAKGGPPAWISMAEQKLQY